MSVSTGANAGFTATGGGTVNATQNNTSIVNTLTSTTGTALNVANTTIGASGLTFRSISANGATNGIVLNSTGASGGLTVTGNGGACSTAANCTGGAIQNISGVGILLTSTKNPSFDRVFIQNTTHSGVKGSVSVDGFGFTNGVINNSGLDAGGNVVGTTDDGNIAFNTVAATTEINLIGTVTITGNSLSNAYYRGIDIYNFGGTRTVTISNNTLTSSTDVLKSKGAGIRVVTEKGGVLTKATIDSNHVNNFPTDVGIDVPCGTAAGTPTTCGTPGSGTNIIAITNNFVTGQSAAARIGAEGIVALVNTGQGNFDISGNNISNTVGQGISHSAFGNATVTSTITNNTLVTHNSFAAAGIGIGTSFATAAGAAETPNLSTVISGNNVSQNDGNGILAVARDVNGTLNVRISNNTVAAPLTGARPGIRVDSGTANGNNTVCADIFTNTTAGSGSVAGIGLRRQSTNANVFGVEGMGATSSPGVEQYVGNGAGKNPGTANGVGDGSFNGVLLLSATTGFSNCSAAPNAPVTLAKTVGRFSQADEMISSDRATKPRMSFFPVSAAMQPPVVAAPEQFPGSLSQIQVDSVVTAAQFLSLWSVENSSSRVSNAVPQSGAISRPPASVIDFSLQRNGSLVPGQNIALLQSAAAYVAQDVCKHSVPTGLKDRESEVRGQKSEVSRANHARLHSAAQKPLSPQSGGTVNLALGTITPGSTVVLTYQVTVNNAAPSGASTISNQGTVTSSAPTVTTDDPDVGGANDPTLTPLLHPTAANGIVSGRITDTNGNPVEGVVVTLSGGQSRKLITDANGNYRFDNVDTGGFYTVTPTRANFNFNPFNRSFSQEGNRTEAGFTGTSPGDNANPLDTPEYFVRQEYVDILGREPDEGGFNYWSDRLLACGTDATCLSAERINVAAAFFISQEFQSSASFLYDVYAGALGRKPAYAEYAIDRQQVVAGDTLDTEKTQFAQNFVQRAEFMTKYQNATTAGAFVEALIQSVGGQGVDLDGERTNLIGAYDAGADLTQSRAAVLKLVADNAAFKQSQYNAAFVLTEYFGYLRRDAEDGGYTFWVGVLNSAGNYRGMVCSFITSREYQERFSQVVTRSNNDCGL